MTRLALLCGNFEWKIGKFEFKAAKSKTVFLIFKQNFVRAAFAWVVSNSGSLFHYDRHAA